MDKNRKKHIANIIGSAISVSAVILYFSAFAHGKEDTGQIPPQMGAESCEEITQTYFQAFGECDPGLFISAMPQGKLSRQQKLFDSADELYDSYRSQFDDEMEYFTAIYGSDYEISYEMTGSRDAGASDIIGEEYISGRILDITAVIDGYKLKRKCSGTLTVMETKDGWYVYESDFDEVFW